MTPATCLRLPHALHAELQQHLFPGDGNEAAAILVCSRTPGERLSLLARRLIKVPHEACAVRRPDAITWPGICIEQAIEAAEEQSLALMLVHSHPGGPAAFSPLDDRSDREVMPSLFAAHGDLHGSAVMAPGGVMTARVYDATGRRTTLDLVTVAGPDIRLWWSTTTNGAQHHVEPQAKRPMAFTSEMTAELGRLCACVVGASGTGSVVAEQLVRLGFGRVIVIDHDRVEHKNLNRILNTSVEDADVGRLKVSVLAGAAQRARGADVLEPVAMNLMSRAAVLAAAQADVVFSCVDKLMPRSLIDLMGSAFLLPVLDVGVAIPTRRSSESLCIAEVTGRLDYVYPGGPSLADRGVYTPALLQAEELEEASPDEHAQRRAAGYIADSPEQAPSVISLNMRAASACVLEFIARAFPYRHEPNTLYARTVFMLAEAFEESSPDSWFSTRGSMPLATGSQEPLLGLPALGASTEELPC